eukprot:GHVQ01035610.1.p1 GENE.GHVQ01035610.1~~GHVQ01035610.1.p1  ORF type:complete len:294 (-),score=36.36 GHVQ01035610.1:112-993(-)
MAVTMDSPNARVLFLHGLEGGPGNRKQKMLENALGQRNVSSPNLGTRLWMATCTIGFGVICLAFVTAIVLCSIYTHWSIATGVGVGLVILVLILYYVGGRVLTRFMLSRAVAVGQRRFQEFRPNVIVCSSFGAVVLLNMNIPKLPLLLLAPAQDAFSRYVGRKEYCSLRVYPYTIIVHGINDKTVPLDDSIRLCETAEPGRCRLEVIEDDHRMSTVTDEDLRALIREVYDRGKEAVYNLAEEGKAHIDPTIFDEQQIPPDPTTTEQQQTNVDRWSDVGGEASEALLTQAEIAV